MIRLLNYGNMEENEELIDLVCEDCCADYKIPKSIEVYNKERTNVLYRWMLKYCIPCRRKRESIALNSLSRVVSILEKIN